MGPNKTVTVTEALTRNLAPLLEMKVNQDGIPTALEPGDILSFLHEMEQYNAQRTDVMERALILSCMSGDVRNYLAQYENLRMASYTENEEEQKGALLSYDRWDTNRKEERQTCLNCQCASGPAEAHDSPRPGLARRNERLIDQL